MADKAPLYSRAFDENLDSLFEELKLAVRWGRPSILLAVHKSIPGQKKSREALSTRLISIGQSVVEINVSHAAPNAAETILKTKNRDKTVFFVFNIDHGGGADGKDAYKALNLQRESLVENEIRAVFWLTVNEALTLPHHAPDFWAFRHRVVEFSTPRLPKKVSPSAGVLIWHIKPAGDSPQKIRDKISSRERLVTELPERPESLSTRIELLYTLGYLYWALGDSAKSMHCLNSGAKLAAGREFVRMKAWLMNGAAIIDYEAGEHRKALEAYTQLTSENPEDSLLCMNLAVVLCAVGKNSEAISQAKKALRINPVEASLWKTLGWLYVSMGRPDEAVEAFKKSIELALTDPHSYESLAACFSLTGLQAEALDQLALARKYAGEETMLPDVYEQAILGKPDQSVSLLNAAVESGKISRVDIRRDPILRILLDESALNSRP